MITVLIRIKIRSILFTYETYSGQQWLSANQYNELIF